MKKILFICWGNVGRSQMAEGFYNTLTKTSDSWSAGTDKTVLERHIHPIQRIIDVMNECNIDISKQNVKLVTQEMIDKSEQVIIMCEKNKCPDFLLSSDKVIFWEGIEDPSEMSYDDTLIVRDLIHTKVLKIAKSSN